MKKLFTVFALAVAMMFVTSLDAFAAAKTFEMVGTIVEIEYMKTDGSCIVELCILVDVGGGEIWPVQIEEDICGNNDLILKHMAAGDWDLAALDIILDVQMRPTFEVSIMGFQLNDADDCTECAWCQNTFTD